MLRYLYWLLASLITFMLIFVQVEAKTIKLPLPPDVKSTNQQSKSNQTPSHELAIVARELTRRYPSPHDSHIIIVNIRQQRLYILNDDVLKKSYPVSTSQWGIGNREGSNQTPIGVFRITQKFGGGAPAGTIFKARHDTGKVAKIITNPRNRSERDLVTSRVMWLTGLQPGLNKGGDVDTHSRYIYIHGTPEEGRIGMPSSHGCVRMKNADVIALFKQVPVETLVYIAPGDKPLTQIPNHLP